MILTMTCLRMSVLVGSCLLMCRGLSAQVLLPTAEPIPTPTVEPTIQINDTSGIPLQIVEQEVSIPRGPGMIVNVLHLLPGAIVRPLLDGREVGNGVADVSGLLRGVAIMPPVPGRSYQLTGVVEMAGMAAKETHSLMVRFVQPTIPPPRIISVHKSDQPPTASGPGEPFSIRHARFSVQMVGDFNPAAEYQLMAYFNDEQIGWFKRDKGHGPFVVHSTKGFPPGRYRLTVRAVGEMVRFSDQPSQPVAVDYRPTYVRNLAGCCHVSVPCLKSVPSAGQIE